MFQCVRLATGCGPAGGRTTRIVNGVAAAKDGWKRENAVRLYIQHCIDIAEVKWCQRGQCVCELWRRGGTAKMDPQELHAGVRGRPGSGRPAVGVRGVRLCVSGGLLRAVWA